MGKQLAPHQKAAQFRNRHRMGKLLLYIGTKATDDELQYLAREKWACIFTCRNDIRLQEIFLEEEVQTRFIQEELPYNPSELLRGKNEPLPIVPMKREKANGKRTVDPKALRAMTAITNDGQNVLMVVGYDHEPDEYGDDLDLPERFLEEEDVNHSSVVFWGIRNPRMQAALTAADVDWNEEDLSDITCSDEEEEEDDTPISSANKYYFYAKGKRIVAPRGTALTGENQMGVLTQAQIDLISPMGAYRFQQWFNNFLERSGNPNDGPQWYAYTNRCNFSVKRDCEDALVALTRNALDGRWPGKKDSDESRRILVEGDTGSGKSVLLGALAYRIFQEGTHPVVFIHGDTRPSEVSDLLDSLKGACGEDYPRILIVWDCSAYLPGTQSEVREMQQKLEDRYHRFVLVCSSYALPQSKRNPVHYAFTSTGEFQPDESGLVARTGGGADRFVTYYVPISRTLSQAERNSLWNKFRTHSAMEPDQLKLWQHKLEADTDLFQICYKMINLLRSNLREGLRTEHNKVSAHVNTVLRDTLNKLLENREENAVEAALRAAGILTQQADEPYESSEVEELLRKVDIRIAMFSRFEKMEVPYNYVKRLLTEGIRGEEPESDYVTLPSASRKGKLRIQRNTDSYGENLVYSDDSGELDLFELITTRIPWLRCGENESGEFTCSFRNPLEAEIFLENYEVSPQQQVDILIEMLDYYLEVLETGRSISPLFVNNLGKLLRNMGPNSKHPEFTAKGSAKAYEYAQLQEYIYDVIPVLEDICSHSRAVNPHYVCDYITFVREKYTPKEGASLLSDEGLAKFQQMIDLAEQKIRAMADDMAAAHTISRTEERQMRGMRSNANGLLDTLRNEKALCQSILCNHWATYLREGYEGPKPEQAQEWTPGRLVREYVDIYNSLRQILSTGSMKGLYYNTLFKAFLDLYEFFPEDSRLHYANQLRQYVDTCLIRQVDMENDTKGRENMKRNIDKINEKDAGTEYTVDALLLCDAGDENALPEALRNNYLLSLKKKDPSILILAASRRLRAHDAFAQGLMKTSVKDPFTACRQVCQLLSAHTDCVSEDAYALWLLIYTMWVSINAESLYSRAEPRTVKLTPQQWHTLYGYCKSYCDMEDLQAKAEVCLLYALSAYYTRSFRDCRDILTNYRQPLENNDSDRKRHPYRLCLRTDAATRVLCIGRFSAEGNRVMDLELDGFRFTARLNGKTKLHRIPSDGSAVKVEIGLGYAGLSAYLPEDQ